MFQNMWIKLWLYTCYVSLIWLLMFEPNGMIKHTWEEVPPYQGYWCKSGLSYKKYVCESYVWYFMYYDVKKDKTLDAKIYMGWILMWQMWIDN